jgi:glycosyltransferase involved in cell wall biosynthesis
MPVRLLFLNTADRSGADTGVHVMLMKNFLPAEAEILVLSNSEAAGADHMRATLAGIPRVKAVFLPFGRPYETLAGRGKFRQALAYGPSAASLVKAAVFVKKNRIQIIHSSDRPRDASFASLLASMAGTASVIHMHSNVGTHLSRPALWGMRKAAAIFAVSDFTREELATLGLGRDKIHTVYNAVDADHFDPERTPSSPGSIRAPFGIPASAPLVGIAARMTHWKGQRELIGAVSSLSATYPDLHVLVLGADVPAYREECLALARAGGICDRVHFCGYQRDVRPYLQEMDVFVHPSYAEPFGLSIVEAMAMRKPVVACNSGGVPEIITHATDGWLVEPRSVAAVATAIGSLLEHPEARRKMGARARETVRNRFSPRRQCQVAAERYGSLLSASQGAYQASASKNFAN